MGMALTGKVIQMNAKMVRTDFAVLMIAVGSVCFCICVYALLWMAMTFSTSLKKKFRIAAMCVLTAICLGLLIWGYKIPRDKIIHACTDGPVSLEEIAVAYDILEIDGKEMTLRVR